MISQGGNERCPYKRDHQAVTETGPATEFPLLILPGVTVLTMMLIMMVIVMIMIMVIIIDTGWGYCTHRIVAKLGDNA